MACPKPYLNGRFFRSRREAGLRVSNTPSEKNAPARPSSRPRPPQTRRPPRLIGYARVSTADQTTRPQLDALRAAGCAEVFEDVLSGSVDDRDGLQTCLDALRAGDTLVVPRRPVTTKLCTMATLACLAA